jgi:hypothetical protein
MLYLPQYMSEKFEKKILKVARVEISKSSIDLQLKTILANFQNVIGP